MCGLGILGLKGFYDSQVSSPAELNGTNDQLFNRGIVIYSLFFTPNAIDSLLYANDDDHSVLE